MDPEALEKKLEAALAPPRFSPQFRRKLWARIEDERRRAWLPGVLDTVAAAAAAGAAAGLVEAMIRSGVVEAAWVAGTATAALGCAVARRAWREMRA
jgi:hypothetical protein